MGIANNTGLYPHGSGTGLPIDKTSKVDVVITEPAKETVDNINVQILRVLNKIERLLMKIDDKIPNNL